MPTNTRSRTEKSGTELDRDPGLEGLGAGFAPGLPGDETGELVERAGLGAGQPRRGAPVADRPPLSAGAVDEALERVADRRRLRQALGMPSDKRISNELIDELLAGASTEEEIAGPGGLLAELTKRLVERAMEVELTDHVGYEPHQEPPGGAGNTRNGTTPKTLVTEHGPVRIDTPRDRAGSFEPQIVRKRQRRFERFDDKILALYARGMSTRDISAHLEEIYGVEVGRDLISRVTDAVMEDARAWQTRPLDDVYPVVFLDALVLKIRDGGSVIRKACYLALGINLDGDREVLGMWFQDSEGAKFWMQVLSELKQRGVERHPDRLRRRAQRVPGGDRGRVPDDHGPDLHRSPNSRLAEIRAAQALRKQATKDLRPIYQAINAEQADARAREVRGQVG